MKGHCWIEGMCSKCGSRSISTIAINHNWLKINDNNEAVWQSDAYKELVQLRQDHCVADMNHNEEMSYNSAIQRAESQVRKLDKGY